MMKDVSYKKEFMNVLVKEKLEVSAKDRPSPKTKINVS